MLSRVEIFGSSVFVHTFGHLKMQHFENDNIIVLKVTFSGVYTVAFLKSCVLFEYV